MSAASGYTSVTRATDLKNFFFHDYDKNAEREEAMLPYFDRKARRDRCRSRATSRWRGCLGKSCSGGGDALIYERGKTNLAANRIENTVGHELGNVVPIRILRKRAVSNK